MKKFKVHRKFKYPASIDWRTRGAVNTVKNQVKDCCNVFLFKYSLVVHGTGVRALCISFRECVVLATPLQQWLHWKVLTHWPMTEWFPSANRTSLIVPVSGHVFAHVHVQA